jgi:hypothetical protein
MNRKSFEEIEGGKRNRNENEIRGNSAPFVAREDGLMEERERDDYHSLSDLSWNL